MEEQLIKLTAELESSEDVGKAVELISMADVFLARAKELKAMAVEAVLDFISRNGDFEENGIRYYAGDTKGIKPKDLETIVEATITACGGDIKGFTEYLTSNPFKTGAMRKLMGESFDDLFSTEVVPKLKEGKPVKQLKTVDTKYLESK